MKGSAGIFIIIGIIALAFLGFILSQGFLSPQKSSQNYPLSPTPYGEAASSAYTFSNDPKYKEVKEKYNLSEEQLQILSTVDPNDND